VRIRKRDENRIIEAARKLYATHTGGYRTDGGPDLNDRVIPTDEVVDDIQAALMQFAEHMFDVNKIEVLASSCSVPKVTASSAS
jgi:hypothetical protein